MRNRTPPLLIFILAICVAVGCKSKSRESVDIAGRAQGVSEFNPEALGLHFFPRSGGVRSLHRFRSGVHATEVLQITYEDGFIENRCLKLYRSLSFHETPFKSINLAKLCANGDQIIVGILRNQESSMQSVSRLDQNGRDLVWSLDLVDKEMHHDRDLQISSEAVYCLFGDDAVTAVDLESGEILPDPTADIDYPDSSPNRTLFASREQPHILVSVVDKAVGLPKPRAIALSDSPSSGNIYYVVRPRPISAAAFSSNFMVFDAVGGSLEKWPTSADPEAAPLATGPYPWYCRRLEASQAGIFALVDTNEPPYASVVGGAVAIVDPETLDVIRFFPDPDYVKSVGYWNPSDGALYLSGDRGLVSIYKLAAGTGVATSGVDLVDR